MKNFIVILLVAFFVGTGLAAATSVDQGKRATPPLCIGKRFLKPVYVGGIKLTRAGAVRSVAVTEKCQSTEQRGLGVAVADPDTNLTAPAPVPGPKGDKGDTGAASTVPGPAGPAGAPGKDGKDGTNGLGNGFIYACVSNGGSVQLNVNGQPCGDNQGHTQIKLVVVQ